MSSCRLNISKQLARPASGHLRCISKAPKSLCGVMISLALAVALMIQALAATSKTDLEALTKKAQAGDPQAQFELGTVYYQGRELIRDMGVAFEWFLKAANQGHTEAQFAIGRCYFHGRGVPRDKALGAGWYYEAALQNHKLATYALGECYFLGDGVERNHAESLK